MKIHEISPSSSAKKLAKIVGSPLYLVGGFVRNCLLGKKCDDEDLCSPLTLGQLAEKLEGSDFSLKNKNPFLGTCKIVGPSKSFDYATFRVEEYEKGHTPNKVEFVSSLEEDAARRDFTINAIYYEIASGKIVDPFGGVNDLNKKLIRATSESVLKSDGLRILRMLRLAGEYNFSIEPKTLSVAQKNVDLLKDLSRAKVCEEMIKLFDRTTNAGAVKALRFYNKLGVWKRVGLDVNEIKIKMLSKTTNKIYGFVIDLVDTVDPASVSYFLHSLLQDVGFSKKKLAEFINIISGYYDALNLEKNNQYFFKYFDNFPIIYEILVKKSKILAQKYNFFYKYIVAHKLVIKVSDLKITKKDLKKSFPSMPEKMYDKVLLEALSDVFDGKCPNVTAELIKSIGKRQYHNF